MAGKRRDIKSKYTGREFEFYEPKMFYGRRIKGVLAAYGSVEKIAKKLHVKRDTVMGYIHRTEQGARGLKYIVEEIK